MNKEINIETTGIHAERHTNILTDIQTDGQIYTHIDR